jgi:hypothetical protein
MNFLLNQTWEIMPEISRLSAEHRTVIPRLRKHGKSHLRDDRRCEESEKMSGQAAVD